MIGHAMGTRQREIRRPLRRKTGNLGRMTMKRSSRIAE